MTTIAPVLPAPAPAPSASPSGTDTGTAEEFDAVVRRVEARSGDASHRGGDAAEVSTDAPVTGSDDPTPTDETSAAASEVSSDDATVQSDHTEMVQELTDAAAALAGAAGLVAPTVEPTADDVATATDVEPVAEAGPATELAAPAATDAGVPMGEVELDAAVLDAAADALPTTAPAADAGGSEALPSDRADVADAEVAQPADADAAEVAPAPAAATTAEPVTAPAVGDSQAAPAARVEAAATTRTAGTPEIAQSAGAEHTEAWDQVASVVRPLRTAPDGSHRIALRLRPDDLGTVHLEVAMRDGRLSLHAVADSTAGRDVLSQSLPQLRAALTESGIDLGTLDVSTGTSGDGAHDPHRAAGDASGERVHGSTIRTAPADSPAIAVSPTPTRRGAAAGPGSLDLSL